MKTLYLSRKILTIALGILICNSCSELLPSDEEGSCQNICNDSNMIIGCDNRVVKPASTDGTEEDPWRFIGRFDGGSKCSGTLIGSKFILTAAHCMTGQGTKQLGFALAQDVEAASGRPFGTIGVRRVFVPAQFNSNATEEQAAYDYAVAELWEPVGRVLPANWGHVEWDVLRTKPVFTAGYPFEQPDNGFLGRPWITGDSGGEYHSEQPFEWVDDEEAGLLYTNLDGSGGQSGSPVYSFLIPSQHEGEGIIRKVSGVLIGSPENSCLQDRMWVARLTPAAVEHINNAMNPNAIDLFWNIIDIPSSPTSGPGVAWP